VGVFGTLTVEEVLANGDTALAQAAKPALGEAGFVMMGVGGTLGLVISVLAVLGLVYFVNLSAIASLGSAVALAIFLITSIAAYRLRAETGSRTSVLITGILLTVVVLLVFAVQTLRTEPITFIAMIAILCLAIILDLMWSRIRARRTAAAG
jgi:hypothetical protein